MPNAAHDKFAFLRHQPKLADEIKQHIATGEADPLLAEMGMSRDDVLATLEGRPLPRAAMRAGADEAAAPFELPSMRVEAIVRRFGRPPLLVQNGTYAEPPTEELRRQLAPHRQTINRIIGSVGRVELLNHAMRWVGTGWVVDRNIVITNRHVAEVFAEADGRGGFAFRVSAGGVPYRAQIDFREEYRVQQSQETALARVRYIAPTNAPDIALLEMTGGTALPPPIDLDDRAVRNQQPVAVVGYPAYDSRNDPQDVARYFGDIFDVKRFAPGEISQPAGTEHFFMHDCTTLGGNSGSVVFDLSGGKAVGLHYAGVYTEGNFAVTAEHVQRALRGLKTVIAVSRPAVVEARADGSHPATHFKNRDGYRPAFLGKRFEVSLPKLSRQLKEDAFELGRGSHELKYRHFSVIYSRSRRIPIVTAVNIDGGKSVKIKRADDQWFFDLRVPRELHLDKDDYGHRDIDRGHMVRREDPVWGTASVARQANGDTFHYTNAAPQHARLNQNKATWQGLENYILNSTRTHGFKASVFTGPILRDNDRTLEDTDIKVPAEFFKIVVAIDADRKKLHATGYVLGQGELIRDITEFAFGQFGTYQVPIATIEKVAGLSFDGLAAADPMTKEARRTGLEAHGVAFRLLQSPDDIAM